MDRFLLTDRREPSPPAAHRRHHHHHHQHHQHQHHLHPHQHHQHLYHHHLLHGADAHTSESRKLAPKRERTCEDTADAADSSSLFVALCGGGDAEDAEEDRCVGAARRRGAEPEGGDGDGDGGSSMISTAGQAPREPGRHHRHRHHDDDVDDTGAAADVIGAAASSASAACAKGGKEERSKKGKSAAAAAAAATAAAAMMMRGGWKRERERERDAVVRTRREKHAAADDDDDDDVFAPGALPEPLSRDAHCAAERTGAEDKGAQEEEEESGMMMMMNGLKGGSGGGGGAIVVRRYHDDTPAVKKHRGADKLDPMFTVPSPPAPVASGPPGHSLPPTPKQVVVRTRSIGTNTPDGAGGPGGPEPDSACLGPCQPGTSVNLEGIVWHETEEGVLVVNVTWRKRTYVGTLLDCTKHDWAPPRFCESPSSDPEMPSGRGRGKRMRLAIAERPCVEPLPTSKVRGLSQHRSRGGGVAGASGPIHSKGRRGSLNLMNSTCRAPPSFFTVEEVKPATSNTSLSASAKRKAKPPADLDLSLLTSDDAKLGNGKRIRAKSRSAPSTPQGKADTSFMDPGGGCTSSSPPPPILIDCPHPNCTKRYKHINGLRYHQTHAHLEVEGQRKPELETLKDPESEERLSDCEDALGSMTYNLSEASSTNSNCANSSSANASSTNASGPSSSKKATPLYKVTTVGSPKNRRLLLSTDTAKTRRTSLLRDGLMDDLSNLPIISNMTVVLENCMVPDRSSTVEMPKLEAEGLIDKKGGICDKGKKANGKVEKLSKSRANRPIAPAPAPPKLIAIPTSVYNTSTTSSTSPAEPNPTTNQNPHQPLPPQQPTPLVSGGLSAKNPPLTPLKPIKPKLSIVVEPSLVKTTLVTCSKETRKKEKRRLKDKHNKDTLARMSNGDSGVKMEDSGGGGGPKLAAREAPGSLLKEHLSKQEVLNGLTGSQESRMASIRAEADKVYTFTDNAPSPSIGTSLRLDAGSGMATPDGGSKNNSPAYSDISDAGDDGGAVECRSDGPRSKSGHPSSSSSSSSSSSEGTPNSHHGNPCNSHQGNPSKTPPTASAPLSKDPQSPYYQGYDSYYLQGYMQSDRQNHCSPAFHKGVDIKGKDRKEDLKEDELADSKKTEGCAQSQLQLAMSQTQTALAQSLYYGQYSRGLYTDQKLLLGNKCCDQALGGVKQRSDRGPTGSGRDGEDGKHAIAGSVGGAMLGKGVDGTKGCCSKPTLSYLEMGERGDRGERGERGQLSSILDQQPSNVKSSSSSSSSLHNPNTQTDLDSNVSYSSPPDGLSWAYRRPRCKHPQYPLGLHSNQAEEGEVDKTKEWRATLEPVGAKIATFGGGGVRGGERGGAHHATPISEPEDAERGEEEQGEEPMGGLCEESQSARAAVSPPQQAYLPYQQTPYPPYLALTRSSQGMSPTMAHNYPGFHYPLYGKTAGREDPEGTNHTEPSPVELLHQPTLLSQGKSPAPGERGSPERERESERERNHVSFGRHLHTHHHTHLGVSYNLLSGQYDVYQGLSSRSLVTNQVTGQSPTESQGKK
ncbi:unnamed protein product [Merluccius merluccius]